MTYNLELTKIGNTTLQLLIDWSVSGIRQNNFDFDGIFLSLLKEKLRRNEII